VIRLVVMMYVRYPLSLRNVEDLLAERGIHISHETIPDEAGIGAGAGLFTMQQRRRPLENL
jgi:transposase-like protein